MSTPTPRTDETRWHCPHCKTEVHLPPNPELIASLARIGELEKEESFMRETLRRVCETIGIVTPLQLMAEAENNEESYADILIKVLGRKLDSLTRQLSEAQVQLKKQRLILVANQKIMDGAGDSIRDLQTQLASAREDGARLDWLASNHVEFAEELHRIGWKAPNDAQWEKLKFFLRRIRHAIDTARGHAETPAGGETGKDAWQPIETAPKDGTEILYLSPSIGQWVGCEPTHYARGFWSRRNDGTWGGQSHGYGDETHWAALPPPPQGKETRG